MIVILGESASGKSSIERVLSEKYGYQRIISFTSRPPRDGEQDGIDYYFVTEDKFLELKYSCFFAETGNYRGWYYGTPKNQCTDDKVCVVTPSGMRQLKNNKDLNIVSFYINIPRRDRLIKLLQRDTDIEECNRRSLSDCGQFDGIINEVNYILHNDGYKFTPERLADTIHKIYTRMVNENE
jgi:guanylate kinase